MSSASGIVMKPPAAACTSNQFQLLVLVVFIAARGARGAGGRDQAKPSIGR
jgi:hypothetical protein